MSYPPPLTGKVAVVTGGSHARPGPVAEVTERDWHSTLDVAGGYVMT